MKNLSVDKNAIILKNVKMILLNRVFGHWASMGCTVFLLFWYSFICFCWHCLLCSMENHSHSAHLILYTAPFHSKASLFNSDVSNSILKNESSCLYEVLFWENIRIVYDVVLYYLHSHCQFGRYVCGENGVSKLFRWIEKMIIKKLSSNFCKYIGMEEM